MTDREDIEAVTPDPDGEFYLPRSLYVPKEDPRDELRETVNAILSDKFMAFLSIVLIPIILLPFFFTFSDAVLHFFDIIDGTIILLFVAEYFSKLYLARSRWAYFKAPWHLLDLIIVAFSFLSYLSLLGLNISGSPALLLRLLRLPRALAVTGRVTGSRIRTKPETKAEANEQPETTMESVDANGVHRGLTWDDVSAHLRTKDQEWINIGEVTDKGITTLSSALHVPLRHFKTKVVDEIFPHIDYVQHMSFIFLKSGEIQYPTRAESYTRISQTGLVVICSGTKIITLSPHKLQLFDEIASEPDALENTTLAVSLLYEILESTLGVYKSMFGEIELEVVRIGNTPRSKLPRDFLERMYQLNKEVSRLVSNLVHFKNLLNIVISRRVTLEGFDDRARDTFNVLLDEANFQNELADDLTDNLDSLINLYINQTSFDTNRILKILAVITGVGVIPAVVSGLLGTNLLDVPYQADLWEVLLVTGIAMALATYTFLKLGWLKS
ncbi:MAG: ion transporter [Thaumarchaeota archaeon]|nr:ion transporter [Nitrososphaerota archaeon]